MAKEQEFSVLLKLAEEQKQSKAEDQGLLKGLLVQLKEEGFENTKEAVQYINTIKAKVKKEEAQKAKLITEFKAKYADKL